MLQVDREIELEKIDFDIDNPRFMGELGSDQDKIKQKILDMNDTKDLLKSMREQVVNISRIAVVKIEDDSGKYKAVEGNTRLACFKSGEIEGIDEHTKIKVVELIRDVDSGETEEEFEMQVKLIQGIANVMVVKQWDAVMKARHYWSYYNKLKEMNKDKNENELINELANSMGVKAKEVREGIIRFEFFKTINDLNQVKLSNNQYSFMEGLCRNGETREFLGFDDSEYKFLWDKESCINDGDIDEKKERLSKVTNLINTYDKGSLDFRKDFKILVEGENPSEVYEKLLTQQLNWIAIRSNSIDSVKKVTNIIKECKNKVDSIPIDLDILKNTQNVKLQLKLLEVSIKNKLEQLEMLESVSCE